jgi:hypothetical protein
MPSLHSHSNACRDSAFENLLALRVMTDMPDENRLLAGRVKAVIEYHQHLPDGSLREVKPLLEAEAPLPRPQAGTTPAPGKGPLENQLDTS